MAGRPGRSSGPALRRTVRLLTLLLDAGPAGLDVDSLVAELDLRGTPESQREMVKRDINHLQADGWVIDSIGRRGELGRYRLGQGDPRVRVAFRGEQLREFQRAAALAGVEPARVSESLSSTLGDDLGWQVGAEDSTAYRLSQAAHGHRFRCLLHFDYRDRRRCLSSDAVFNAQGQLYVLGREVVDTAAAQAAAAPDTALPGAEKHFRISRMRDLSLGPAGSAGPAVDAGDLLVDPLTFVQGDPFDAVVTCDEVHRELVQAALGPPSQVRRVDSGLQLTIPVTSRRTFVTRLYRLGTRVRLDGPEELRALVRDELAAQLGGG